MAAQQPIVLSPEQLLRFRAWVSIFIGLSWTLIGFVWLRTLTVRSIFSSPIELPLWPIGLVVVGHGAALLSAVRWPARCGWLGTSRGTTVAYAVGIGLLFLFTARML